MGENTVKIVRGIPKSVRPDRKVVAPARVEISKNVSIVVFEEIDLTIGVGNSVIFVFNVRKRGRSLL